MPNQNPKKYLIDLCDVTAFYVPHKNANYLNAQDVIADLVNSAKNISIATFNCFENGNRLTINDEIVANLVCEIQKKLEMVENLLPMAFDRQEDEQHIAEKYQAEANQAQGGNRNA